MVKVREIAAREISSAQQQRTLHESAAASAAEAFRHESAQRQQLEMRVSSRISKTANVLADALFVASGLGISAGVVLGLPGVFPADPGWRITAWIVAILVSALNVLNLVFGICLQQLRLRLRRLVADKLRGWLTS